MIGILIVASFVSPIFLGLHAVKIVVLSRAISVGRAFLEFHVALLAVGIVLAVAGRTFRQFLGDSGSEIWDWLSWPAAVLMVPEASFLLDLRMRRPRPFRASPLRFCLEGFVFLPAWIMTWDFAVSRILTSNGL